MSLFLMERIEEQKEEDSENDKIIFTYPWILQFPLRLAGNGDIDERESFMTNYGVESERWYIRFSNNGIQVYNDFRGSSRFWNGTCFISYNLFYDNEMRFLYHSSIVTKMTEAPNQDKFETHDGYMTKILEAIKKNIPQKMVIFIELHLPTKNFFRPFEKPGLFFGRSLCNEYPAILEDDYRFGFLNKSDYMIICPDGSIPCRRIMLNLTSRYMRKYLMESNNAELVVNHSIDVVKPIVYFLHSLCFKMPKCYDLNFADRLFKAIYYFYPERLTDITESIHQSLCHKFSTEPNDFDSILRWTSISWHYSLHCLQKMVTSVIVQKYYFKWHQTFPENVRTPENPLFRRIFGFRDQTEFIFRRIDIYYKKSLLTNVILQ